MMFDRANEAEKVHIVMYKAAAAAVAQGQDVPATDIFVCPVCGFTMDGHAPDTCPICGAPKAKFVKF
jgi:rubrerythrin